MNEHRITGSAVTRTPVLRRQPSYTMVTLTCSCGATVSRKGRNLAVIEVKVRRAYKMHKKGR